jgi:hypothetical protein
VEDEVMNAPLTRPYTAAEKAVMHLVAQIKRDPRLAYLIGPGSESFELLVNAHAVLAGEELDPYRESLLGKLVMQPVPGIGKAAGVVASDLWDEILGVNNYELEVDQQGSVDYLVNHFVRLGLRAYRAEVDSRTEELF